VLSSDRFQPVSPCRVTGDYERARQVRLIAMVARLEPAFRCLLKSIAKLPIANPPVKAFRIMKNEYDSQQ
jgi:hypothetical protein